MHKARIPVLGLVLVTTVLLAMAPLGAETRDAETAEPAVSAAEPGSGPAEAPPAPDDRGALPWRDMTMAAVFTEDLQEGTVVQAGGFGCSSGNQCGGTPLGYPQCVACAGSQDNDYCDSQCTGLGYSVGYCVKDFCLECGQTCTKYCRCW